MISQRINGFQSPQAWYSRAISLLLLGFIFYGTTVEAAHRHRRITAADNGLTQVSQTDTQERFSNDLSGCDDCLICQLHQSFSATTLSIRPLAAPHLSRQRSAAREAVVFQSESSNTSRGRAPPLNS